MRTQSCALCSVPLPSLLFYVVRAPSSSEAAQVLSCGAARTCQPPRTLPAPAGQLCAYVVLSRLVDVAFTVAALSLAIARREAESSRAAPRRAAGRAGALLSLVPYLLLLVGVALRGVGGVDCRASQCGHRVPALAMAMAAAQQQARPCRPLFAASRRAVRRPPLAVCAPTSRQDRTGQESHAFSQLPQ